MHYSCQYDTDTDTDTDTDADAVTCVCLLGLQEGAAHSIWNSSNCIVA
jgi:hypothetical protein